MLGTLFSIIIAGYLFFYPLHEEMFINPNIFTALLFVVATLFIFAQTIITVFSWGTLQKLEQNLTPKVTRSFINDRHLRVANLLIIGFLLISYFFGIDIVFLKILNQTAILVIWTISLGIAVDLLNYTLKRVMSFHDPYFVVDYFGDSAQECIRTFREPELLDWIDSLSESSIKAASKNSITLATHALDKLKLIAKNFLQVAKGISYHEEEVQEAKDVNNVGYTMFYLFTRLELIFQKSLDLKLESICSDIIALLGKITIFSANYDISMASYPIHYLGKLALKAEKNKFFDTSNRATLAMVEVSKSIVNDLDLKYLEINDLFLSIISYMQKFAKENFRQDKNIDIALLVQPFKELKTLFQSEKVKDHTDTPVIVQSCDRIIDEFNTLETVLKTMPPITEYSVEKEKPAKKPKKKEKK